MSIDVCFTYLALMSLSKGVVSRFQSGNTDGSAVVKILNVRSCVSSTAGSDDERYRVTINDGQDSFDACILAPTLNPLVQEKRLCENTVVELEKVVHNVTSTGKPFLTIVNLKLISPMPVTTISTPTASNICPIAMITPYINGRWKFRGRCFAKSAIRPHPVCHFDFVDSSGEIRVTAFRDQCNEFHPIVEPNQIYEVSNVRVKMADKRWNNLRHQFELTLTPNSIIQPVSDTEVQATIPEIYFDFVPLSEVTKRSNDAFVDVIGIIESCTDLIPFVNRTSNRDANRRELTLVDEGASVSVTLWDEQAENFDEELAKDKAVIAFQRIRVAIFNNKYSLSGHKNMVTKINPDLPEAKHLRIWYDAGGFESRTFPSSPRPSNDVDWMTIGNIEKNQLGRKGRADFVNVKALCAYIANDRVVYASCSNIDCRKKLNKLSSGLYRCDRCGTESNKCRWSYMIRAELVDSTGAIWVTFFHEQAQLLMENITAEQYAQAKENNDEVTMQTYLNKNSFQEKIFRLKVNEETFNDVTIIKISCISINEIDYSEYGLRLISDLSNQS